MSTGAPIDAMQSEELPNATLDELVGRVRSLYSLPAVAAEVIELTNNPRIDVRALKDCIEVDPALTTKLLRVVNSSLFGLSREVNDLNQAIALLGTKPLKLLVLGFSLPENLFRDVAREQLDWYWAKTLARAVAAREISEQLWERPGDDAFLAGLLQDIGILVLLGEIRQPYAQFLNQVIEKRIDLQWAEVDLLGFDHRSLSAALLDEWKMPSLLVQAIAEPRQYQRLKHKQTAAAELGRILHLADLLAELVAHHRLDVFADVLEVGEAYCELGKDRLKEIVGLLETKVSPLAKALSLDVETDPDYTAVLREAHQQMALIAEGVAEPLSRVSGASAPLDDAFLADASRVREAVGDYLQSFASEAAQPRATGASGTTLTAEDVVEQGTGFVVGTNFMERLTLLVGRCRSLRQPLSVLLLEVRSSAQPHVSLEQALDAACVEIDCVGMEVERVSSLRRAVMLPNCERQETVRHATAACGAVQQWLERHKAAGGAGEFVVSAGVATVPLAMKNFEAAALLQTAERCLAAAQSSGTRVVKSLEIY